MPPSRHARSSKSHPHDNHLRAEEAPDADVPTIAVLIDYSPAPPSPLLLPVGVQGLSATPYVPRPSNSFMLFRAYQMRFNPFAKTSGQTKDLWDALAPTNKEPWTKMALQLKSAHKTVYPSYKYQPVRSKKVPSGSPPMYAGKSRGVKDIRHNTLDSYRAYLLGEMRCGRVGADFESHEVGIAFMRFLSEASGPGPSYSSGANFLFPVPGLDSRQPSNQNFEFVEITTTVTPPSPRRPPILPLLPDIPLLNFHNTRPQAEGLSPRSTLHEPDNNYRNSIMYSPLSTSSSISSSLPNTPLDPSFSDLINFLNEQGENAPVYPSDAPINFDNIDLNSLQLYHLPGPVELGCEPVLQPEPIPTSYPLWREDSVERFLADAVV